MGSGFRAVTLVLSGCAALSAADTATFEKTVAPVLTKTCTPCHNENVASGGVNIAQFTQSSSLTTSRDGWDIILRKIRSGEMPPKGIPRPAQMDAVIQYLQDEFEKADRNIKPDPGRVTARRLNRSEYSNTIRDLLGVEFHAEQSFPTDDLGNGFDNIGDVLTISPVLMDRYLAAAGKIASRAVGADPLPKPLEAQYANKDKKIRRVDFSTIEARGRIEFDGEYIVRFGLPGERGPDAKPVTLAFWMDGKLLNTMPAETKPSKLVYFDPYSEEQMRLFLPEGDHVFRAAFLDDDFVKGLTAERRLRSQEEQVHRFHHVRRALRSEDAAAEPCEDLHLRSEFRSRRASKRSSPIWRIMRGAGRSPRPRPHRCSSSSRWRKPTANPRSREFNWRSRRCWSRRTSSSASNTTPTRSMPPRRIPITDLELASRLSYFLWSSMPDDELLALAEAGKLRAAGYAGCPGEAHARRPALFRAGR